MTQGEALTPEAIAVPSGLDRLRHPLFLERFGHVVRTVAMARIADRRAAAAGGDDFVAAEWVPAPEHLGTLEVPGGNRLARWVSMANNIEQYKRHAMDGSGLRADQIEPFESLLNFISYRGHEGMRSARHILADTMWGGYAVLPTGFGKTALMAKLTEAAGIGTHPNADPKARPLKAIVLVPTTPILRQTIGKGKDDGFEKFAPDKKATPYYREVKDLSGDVVVMTYHSFSIAVKQGFITKEMFDLVIADEAHHLLRPKWLQALHKFTQHEIPVVGLTASPRANANRQLSNVFGREICRLHIRDLIDMRVLSDVQLLAVSTSKKIKVRRRQGDYTEEELYDLARDPDRNKEIVHWAALFVEQGRQVLSFTIRGDNCWHARHLAAITSLQTVYDTATGMKRPVVARAIGSFLKTREYDEIMAQWEQGKVDVLYVVDKLREGWSSRRVNAVLDVAPTSSELVETQRFGRSTRISDKWPVTVYVTFLDEITGQKPQFTPWHVLGEAQIDNGKVLGKRSRSGTALGKIVLEDLPPELYRSLGYNYTLVDELSLTATAEEYKDPPEGWVPIAATTHLWQGLSYNNICDTLERHGYEKVRAKGPRQPINYIPPEAVAFLKTYTLPPIASDEYRTITAVAAHLNRTYKYVKRVTRDLHINLHDMRAPNTHQPGSYVHENDVLRLEEYIKERSTFKEGDESTAALVRELGIENASLLYFMAKNADPILPETKILPESGREGFVISALEAAVVRRHFKETLITDGKMSIDMIREATGRTRAYIIQWIHYLQLEGRIKEGLKPGRYRMPDSGKLENMQYLEADEAATVVFALKSGERLPEGTVKLIQKEKKRRQELMQMHSSGEQFLYLVRRARNQGTDQWQEYDEVQMQLHATDFAMKCLMRAVHPKPSELRKSRYATRLLQNSLIARMGEYCLARVGFAPDQWVSMERLAYAAKTTHDKVEHFMQAKVIAPRDYGICRAQQGYHQIDMYYSQTLAIPAYSALKRR